MLHKSQLCSDAAVSSMVYAVVRQEVGRSKIANIVQRGVSSPLFLSGWAASPAAYFFNLRRK